MKFQKLFLCVDVVGRPGKEVSETVSECSCSSNVR